MRLTMLAAVAMLAACRSGERAPVRATASAPPAKLAPHGSVIEKVRIASGGGAALTVDGTGAMRLWPSLDGEIEPVIVRGSGTGDVAIARDGDAIVVGALDASGGILLRTHGRDGRLLGTASLAPDPGYVELVATATRLVTLGRDNVIAWLRRDGGIAATLAPSAGERIDALVARGAALAALIRREDNSALLLRRIEGTSWGDAYKLPAAIDPMAISPSGTRIAGFLGDGSTAMFELAGGEGRAVAKRYPVHADLATGGTSVAFLDEDRVYWMPGARLESWEGKESSRIELGVDPAAGDGILVAGNGASLVTHRDGRTRYLGYAMLAEHAPLAAAGAHLVFMSGQRMHALDAALRPLGATQLVKEHGAELRPLDEHRIWFRGTAPTATGGAWTQYAELADMRTGERARPVAVAPAGHARVFVEPATRTIGISDAGTLRRFRVAPTGVVTTPLPALPVSERGTPQLLDPAVAGGLAVIAFAPTGTGWTVSAFTDDDPQPRWTATIAEGWPIGADRTGTLYVVDRPAGRVRAYRDGAFVRDLSIPLAPIPEHSVVDASGAIGLSDGMQIVLLDGVAGAVRWKRRHDHVHRLLFAGARLIVSAAGGVVALDATTGEPRGAWCGVEFHAYDRPPPWPTTEPTPSACE
ncbi:MAG: hypothetical protein KIT31_15530 [Deltaproteobacteria bacterium]|nr:hypothetical protein [Deltaproteobacteria bacterium]